MNPFKATMQQAIAGMDMQTRRLNVTSENISNADTPGYKRKILVPDTEIMSSPGDAFRQAYVELDQTDGEQIYNPSHPMADDAGYVTSSNVALMVEMADMREANRSYEANLNSFQQARSMYSSLLDILKR